eukprot:2011291-Pleurochrysis_carterae.AAC.1
MSRFHAFPLENPRHSFTRKTHKLLDRRRNKLERRRLHTLQTRRLRKPQTQRFHEFRKRRFHRLLTCSSACCGTPRGRRSAPTTSASASWDRCAPRPRQRWSA